MYWIFYGELNNYPCEELILKKYSIQIFQVGCEVTNELIKQITFV